jgi:pimeloyl-ACP methyl ester carboxylesterase
MEQERTTIYWLADGRALAVEEVGPPDGVPVFLLNSLFGCRVLPAPAKAAAEATGIRLISPDRPGLGLSDFQKNRRLMDWPDDSSSSPISLA